VSRRQNWDRRPWASAVPGETSEEGKSEEIVEKKGLATGPRGESRAKRSCENERTGKRATHRKRKVREEVGRPSIHGRGNWED